jgi:hypothetical protein
LSTAGCYFELRVLLGEDRDSSARPTTGGPRGGSMIPMNSTASAQPSRVATALVVVALLAVAALMLLATLAAV